MKKIALKIAMLSMAGLVQADPKPAFTGQNYSGVYDCKGDNDKVGEYEVTIALKINRVSSYGKFGAYNYEMTTVNAVTYIGQAIAEGNMIALSFPLKNGLNVDHSIGIAKMVKNKQGRWSFRKHYYEEDNSGGNYGSEYCVLNINKPFEDLKPPSKGKEPAKGQSKEQPKNPPMEKEPVKKDSPEDRNQPKERAPAEKPQ